MLSKIWDALVRWRTWLLNLAMALAFVLPEVLNSTEILAVIPAEYQRWFLVAAFLVNIWMRPRPATVSSDPEVQVKKALKRTGSVAVIEVKADGLTKAVIRG